MARSTRFSCFSLALLAAAGATANSACTGEIGSSEDGPPVVEPPGTPSGQDAGRVTLHRLNRVEYNNTVKDLLGSAQSPADAFPADDHAFGFDNMADTLVLSTLAVMSWKAEKVRETWGAQRGRWGRGDETRPGA